MIFHSKESSGSAGRDIDLGVDILNMAVNSLEGDRQFGRDLFHRLTSGEQTQYFDFTFAQASYNLFFDGRRTLACRHKDCIDHIAIETTGSDFALEFLSGPFE